MKVKNFRGFQKEQSLDFSKADLVLLVGNNGYGKTSFFDAVQWGLTGTIKRYDQPDREKNSEIFLRNHFGSTAGQVNLQFAGGTSPLTISRETESRYGNDYNDGKLKINGESAAEAELKKHLIKANHQADFDFARSFNFSHLLSQELINDFVRGSKGKDRYSLLSNLVGLKNYQTFTEQLKIMKNICKEKQSKISNKITRLEKEEITLKEKTNTLALSELKLSTKFKAIQLKMNLSNLVNYDQKLYSGSLEDFLKEKKLQILQQQKEQEIEKLHKIAQQQEELNSLEKQSAQLPVWREELNHKQKKLQQLHELSQVQQLLEKYNFITANYYTPVKLTSLKEKITLLSKKLTEINASFDSDDLKAEHYLLEKEFKKIEKMINQVQQLKNRILSDVRDYLDKNPLDYCPVCLNEIDWTALRVDLTERIKDDQQLNTDLFSEREKLQQQLALLEEYFDKQEKQQQLQQFLTKHNRAAEMIAQLDLVQSEKLLENLKEKQEKLAKQLMEYENNDFEKETTVVRGEIAQIKQQIDQFKEKLADFEIEKVEELKELYQQKTEQFNHSKLVVNDLAEKETALQKIIEQYQNQQDYKKLLQVRDNLNKSKQQADYYQSKINELANLEKKVPEVINQLTEKTLEPYQELANFIYQKINPQPLFPKLGWERTSQYAKGNLILKMKNEQGLTINPSFVYSSAQVNIVVLAFFFSFVVQNNWSKLQTVFLDDPVQNMDDLNIFAFVDVIRWVYYNLPQPPQFFISTHDRKIAAFLQKKFRKLNLQVLEFTGFDEEGPVINTHYC